MDWNQKLIFYAELGNLNRVEHAIDQGADVNTTDDNGWTPLICACQCEHPHVVEFLLAHGADKTLRDEDGKTAKDYANGNEEILKLLEK